MEFYWDLRYYRFINNVALLFAKSVSEYERILSFTMLGTKNPLVVSLAQRLIIVLLLTPIRLLISIGVNS